MTTRTCGISPCRPEPRRGPATNPEEQPMTADPGPQRGQSWRNIYGAHVIVGDPGVAYHDGQPHNVLWVTPCTPGGARIGTPIPTNPPTPDDGFPGYAWTYVGRMTEVA